MIMRNIKYLVLLLIQVTALQFTVAQVTLDNGRPEGAVVATPTETDIPTSTATETETNTTGVFSDQDVPGEEAPIPTDTYYPTDFDIMQDEIQASTNPALVAERINELNDHVGDLRRVIEELRLENKVIRESLGNCCSNSALGLSASDAYLIQNAPNPFNETSQIKYFIPGGLEDVEIRIADVKGETLKSIKIEEAGYGTIEVSANNLSTGSFIYMISVKGEIVDSKVMIITQ